MSLQISWGSDDLTSGFILGYDYYFQESSENATVSKVLGRVLMYYCLIDVANNVSLRWNDAELQKLSHFCLRRQRKKWKFLKYLAMKKIGGNAKKCQWGEYTSKCKDICLSHSSNTSRKSNTSWSSLTWWWWSLLRNFEGQVWS